MVLISDSYFQYRSALLNMKKMATLERVSERDLDNLMFRMSQLWDKLNSDERARINSLCSLETK